MPGAKKRPSKTSPEPAKKQRTDWSLDSPAELASHKEPVETEALEVPPNQLSPVHSGFEPSALIDLKKMGSARPDESLIPECIWGSVCHRTSGKKYYAIEWKNATKEHVQFVEAQYAQEHYPQAVTDFLAK